MDSPLNRQPRLIRRVLIAAREGVMQCPRCSYVLSYSDALLCRVGDTHYCPRCWSRIPDSVEPVAGGSQDPAEAGKEESKDDVESHVARQSRK